MSKVWFITGTTRGLGRALIKADLESGHQVVATARRPEQLANLVTTRASVDELERWAHISQSTDFDGQQASDVAETVLELQQSAQP